MHWRENNTLCGILYLKLEDFFDATMQTLCLPLDPQGILIFEVLIIMLTLTRLGGQSLKDCVRIDMYLLLAYMVLLLLRCLMRNRVQTGGTQRSS